MKVFLDTSVLISAVVKQHVSHERSFSAVERIQNRQDEGVIAAHSLAEMYALLTKLPPPYRHTPEQALLSVEENVLKHFKIISLVGSEYAAVLREVAGIGVQGGTVYDALLLKSAAKAGAAGIYTLNLKHFQAIAPQEVAVKLSLP